MIKKWLQLHFYLKIAIGREGMLLKILKRITSAVPEDDPKNAACIEWIHAQDLKKITIKSRDNLNLCGYYLEHPEASRIILMFHGWRGGWDRDCAALAQELFAQKCSVLIVNQRAQGNSEGKYIGFGILERFDCLNWIAYLDSHTVDLPIYLFGVSMGAATVLMASCEEMPERIKGIIADCGFTSAYEMAKIFTQKFMHLKKEQMIQTIDEMDNLCKKKAGYHLQDFTTLEALSKCKIPVFFAHGTADSFVPYEMSLENYKICVSRKTLYSVEGADHAQSYITDPKAYLTSLKQFFEW